jgi:hypothetical protein
LETALTAILICPFLLLGSASNVNFRDDKQTDKLLVNSLTTQFIPQGKCIMLGKNYICIYNMAKAQMHTI